MTLRQIAVLVIASGGWIALLVHVRTMWRADPQDEQPPPWWFLGESLWVALNRTTPLYLVLIPPALVAYVLDTQYRDSDDPAVVAAGITAAFTVLGIIGLMVMIVLFNRPRFLVPPPRRDQPGLLEQRRA